MILPLTHVTPWEKFISIKRDNHLVPQKCSLFKEEILYMNYGRLAHKPSKKDYNWNENSPVVLFFESRLLANALRFFPFDTGAILAGRFKYSNLNNLKLLRNMSMNISQNCSPSMWIKSKYSNPSDYIKYISPDLLFENSKTTDALREAYSILQKPNSTLDYRLTSIECHFKTKIPLEYAKLIAVPLEKKEEFLKLRIFPASKIFYYNEKSENGYLPNDLSTFATKIFLSELN